MQPITVSAPPASPPPRQARGRWIWALSGLLTIGVLGGLLGRLAIDPPRTSPGGQKIWALPAQALTVAGTVTAVSVTSYGDPIKVTAQPGTAVRVTAVVAYNVADGGPPAVTHTDSHGLLTLAAPACARSDCSVAFTVTVPPGTTVSAASDGGSVSVAGTGAASLDSGGGPAWASQISGPLTVNAEGGQVTVDQVGADASLDSGGGPVAATNVNGALKVRAEGGEVTAAGAGATTIDSGGGPVSASAIRGPLSVTADGGGVQVDGVSGALSADTGGGPLSAGGLGSASATVTTEGSDVTLGFTSPPQTVRVTTGGGQATLALPGGPYAVSTDGGAADSVSVPTSPGATSSVNVSTEGGNAQIGPA